jgi:hypothetical protein
MIKKNKFSHTYLLLWLVILTVASLSACISTKQGDNLENVDAVGTAAAQTVAVQMQAFTETAQSQIIDTPIPPTSLPVLTEANLPTSTLPSTAASVVATQDTNCREGPGTDYNRVGMLQARQEMPARGRNVDASWWFIDHPSTPGSTCWVWGGSTNLKGDASSLEIVGVAPPPATTAPTLGGANASIEYSHVHPCGTETGMVTFIVQNTGSVEFRSMELTIKLIRGDVTLYYGIVNNPFLAWANDCQGSLTLPPGSTSFFGGIIQNEPPWKQKGRAIGRLCSLPDAQGECEGFQFEFYFLQ